jgi:L-iditol 2-dehydrogenase
VSAAAASFHSSQLRRAMLVAPGQLEIRPFVPPRLAPGEILVQVRCALSCGTDLKAWRRGHPLWKMPTPLGHEFAGVVAEVGAGVSGFDPGDEIMAAPTAPCGTCFYCSRGQENLCATAIDKMVLGAYGDMLILPAHIVSRNVFTKPHDLPFEEAALLEPLSCVVHAQAMALPERHERVLILGAGPFGLLHMLALRVAGVQEVAVAGRGDARLRWAAEMGADRVIDVRRQDAAAAAAELNGGFGPDLVIECTGQVDGWSDALARTRRGGRVVLFGGCPPGTALNVDTRRMHYDGLSMIAPFHYRPRDVRRSFELLRERRLGAERLINAHRNLSDLAEVFSMMDRGTVLKCAVVP